MNAVLHETYTTSGIVLSPNPQKKARKSGNQPPSLWDHPYFLEFSVETALFGVLSIMGYLILAAALL